MLSFALFSAGALAQPFPMSKQGEVAWVCAGIGEPERAAFSKMEQDANLKLVFASGKRGAYLADVGVLVTDREGKRPALKFKATGPICLLQAPAGRYQVDALFRDEKRSLGTTVPAGAKQPGVLVFRFPDEN
jgi:hypothetical protein